jgi:hypothetical protein
MLAKLDISYIHVKPRSEERSMRRLFFSLRWFSRRCKPTPPPIPAIFVWLTDDERPARAPSTTPNHKETT